jgi:hypothetical protein
MVLTAGGPAQRAARRAAALRELRESSTER